MSQDTIQSLSLARLQSLEDDLRSSGLYMVAGGELEHMLLRNSGMPYKEKVDEQRVRAAFNAQQYYKETYEGKYEIVFGNSRKVTADRYAVAEVAQAMVHARAQLPDALSRQGIPETSFLPVTTFSDSTCGSHHNISAADANGNNLFCDKRTGMFSNLALATA